MVAHSSGDEWATTKQVCRDELVVYLFFPLHNIYKSLYIYIRVIEWLMPLKQCSIHF